MKTSASVPADSALQPSAPLALLRRLEWRVRHAVETVLSGEYRSAFRGRGMEFDQVVKYEFGDDVRDIDWNVTARLGDPYRKKFIEEREVTLLIVFEDSPSLQFGSAALSKREALLELAGLVMLLGAVNRDRVGFVYATPHGNLFRQPVRGRGPILHAAATLLGQPAPELSTFNPALSRFDQLKAPSGSRGLPNGSQTSTVSNIPWQLLYRAMPKHTILVWLGDFPARPAPDGWAVLQRRYSTMGFRVDDPWERALPADETFAAYDPLAGRLVTLDGSAAQQTAHAQWRATREAAWSALFPDRRSRLVVTTEEDRFDALVRFFRARMAAAAR